MSLVEDILHRTGLYIRGQICRICEIEFYLYNDQHPDPYVHQNSIQRTFGSWYFHPKGGTFKGLDFTLSRNSSELFSVLIRSIETPTGQIIEGPCKVVDYILSMYGLTSVWDLTHGHMYSFIPQADPYGLYLIKYDFPPESIYSGPRVGLSDKYPNYLDCRYRYLIQKDRIRKQKSKLEKI